MLRVSNVMIQIHRLLQTNQYEKRPLLVRGLQLLVLPQRGIPGRPKKACVEETARVEGVVVVPLCLSANRRKGFLPNPRHEDNPVWLRFYQSIEQVVSRSRFVKYQRGRAGAGDANQQTQIDHWAFPVLRYGRAPQQEGLIGWRSCLTAH